MYHFFVTPEQVLETSITITGTDVNHIKNVLRMKVGEALLISNGLDKDYHCEILEMTALQVTAKILEIDEEGTELSAKLYLFQGLPKSDKMELIIQKAVELGVYQILPVVTKRTIVKLDAKKEDVRRKRWNGIAESAAKQSKRIMIPEVIGVMTWADALRYASELDVNLIPYEHAEGMAGTKKELEQIKPGMSVGIFIGPEGGFDDHEIEQAQQLGITPITLGRRILRTETAGLAVLSILMFQLES
ncbi:MAG: 16S rRNA (uracil(1498)-N(3))-methyltransferase [Hungatella sp.]